jgi:SAM-dependent methyltransferase
MNSPEGKAILARVRGGDHAHPGEEAAIVEAAALVDRTRVRRILDVGCGRGGTAAWFRQQGWGEVVGIDIDADSVSHARSSYPGVDFLVADVGHLDRLGLAPVDLVYLLTAYYAFPDQALALRKLAQACRAGGQLLLVDYTCPAGVVPPPELGGEIGRPVGLEALVEGLSRAAWVDVRVTDWTSRFVDWYADLLQRFGAQRQAIVAEWGPDWYDYVSRWYGALHAALVQGRLGGAVITATRGGGR